MSILRFLGCGSAYNPAFGSTSAYMETGSCFFLLDCGETVFSSLFQTDVFDRCDEFYIAITHTHADHVGSLGSLISYCYYIKKKRVVIIHPNHSVVHLLKRMGVEEGSYTWIKPSALKLPGIEVKEILVKHAEDLKCYGYFLTKYGRTVYYSGDSYEVPEMVVKALMKGELEAVYQDTTEFSSDRRSHCPLPVLEQVIPRQYRKYVYCMHFTNDFSDKIRDCGFNTVEIAEKESRLLYVSDGYTHSYEGKQLLCKNGCGTGSGALSSEGVSGVNYN